MLIIMNFVSKMTLVELLRLLPLSKFHNQKSLLDDVTSYKCLISQVTKKDFWILFPKMKAGNIPKICKYGIFSKFLNSFLSNICFNDVN